MMPNLLWMNLSEGKKRLLFTLVEVSSMEQRGRDLFSRIFFWQLLVIFGKWLQMSFVIKNQNKPFAFWFDFCLFSPRTIHYLIVLTFDCNWPMVVVDDSCNFQPFSDTKYGCQSTYHLSRRFEGSIRMSSVSTDSSMCTNISMRKRTCGMQWVSSQIGHLSSLSLTPWQDQISHIWKGFIKVG